MNFQVREIEDGAGQQYLALVVSNDIIEPYLNQLKGILQSEYELYTSNRERRDGSNFHITILSNKEYSKIRKVPIQAWMFYKDLKQLSTQPELIGIGMAKRQEEESYFIVVESPDINKLMEGYGLGPRDFHITLGFKNKDIWDGPKNRTTLINMPIDEIRNLIRKEILNFIV